VGGVVDIPDTEGGGFFHFHFLLTLAPRRFEDWYGSSSRHNLTQKRQQRRRGSFLGYLRLLRGLENASKVPKRDVGRRLSRN